MVATSIKQMVMFYSCSLNWKVKKWDVLVVRFLITQLTLFRFIKSLAKASLKNLASDNENKVQHFLPKPCKAIRFCNFYCEKTNFSNHMKHLEGGKDVTSLFIGWKSYKYNNSPNIRVEPEQLLTQSSIGHNQLYQLRWMFIPLYMVRVNIRTTLQGSSWTFVHPPVRTCSQ